MTTRETLEGRIYLAEEAMYRRSDELDRQLRELWSRLEDLTAAAHRMLWDRGSTPLELKTGFIAQAIEDFEARIDLSAIRATAERITSLKGLIDNYERELKRSEVPGGTFEGASNSRILAAAS